MTQAQLSAAFLDALLRYQTVVTAQDENGSEFFVFTRPEDDREELDTHSIVSFAEAHARVWGVCCACHKRLAAVFVPDSHGQHWAVVNVRKGVAGIFEPGRGEPVSIHPGTTIASLLAGVAERYH